MLRFTVALLALVVAEPAFAASTSTFTGNADGQNYSYTAELLRNDVLRLTGRMTNSQQDFVLLVSRDGYVTGRFGYSPVSFKVSKETRDRAVEGVRSESMADTASEAITTASR